MGAMVHPHLTKQKNYYTASFALLQFSTQFLQQALNINPLYVTANRASKRLLWPRLASSFPADLLLPF